MASCSRDIIKVPTTFHRTLHYSKGFRNPDGLPLHIAQAPTAPAPPELVTQILFYKGFEDKLRAEYPDFPAPFSTPGSVKYKIVPVQRTGVGMVATADIAPGETILRERPTMLYPACLTGPSLEYVTGLLDAAVRAMPIENQRMVLSLKNWKGKNAPSNVKGILDTNSLTAGTLPGYDSTYAALARDICRVNHSCTPNAFAAWDLRTLSYSLRAIAPIKAGDEITISYSVTTLQPYEMRQEEMKRRYGFRCTCKACQRFSFARDKSDITRTYLLSRTQAREEDDALFEKWVADGALVDPAPMATTLVHGSEESSWSMDNMNGFRLAEVTWNLMDQEGCYDDDLWEPLLAKLVKGYSILGDVKKVRRYARRAAQLRTAFDGTDAGWKAVADHPRETDWWKKLECRT